MNQYRTNCLSAARAISLLLLCLFVAPSSFAHKLAPSLLEITETRPHHYEALWRTPAGAKIAPAPEFPSNCNVEQTSIASKDTAMEWRWNLSCLEGLGGQSLSINHLGASRTAALLRFQSLEMPLKQQLLSADNSQYVFPTSTEQNQVFSQYLRLGAKHILIGIDHLFFVAGLLLLAGNTLTLLKTVTAFTLGHSVTLALVSLNILPQWPALIEFGIAVTILILALELSQHRSSKGTFLSRYQWPVAAGFGLIHGLGFAGVLSELGLPNNDILLALLSFNIGIELGQLAFVSTLALLLALLYRVSAKLPQNTQHIFVYFIGTLAVFLFFDRGFSLVQ